MIKNFFIICSIIAPNIGLISRAFRRQFIIPEFQDFCKDIEEIYWRCKDNTDGKVRFSTLHSVVVKK